VQIGIRTWNDDFMGIRILDAQWVHDNGTKAVIEEVKRVVGSHTAYLTFDIDCLDPAHRRGPCRAIAGR
jgi:agmatinase